MWKSLDRAGSTEPLALHGEANALRLLYLESSDAGHQWVAQKLRSAGLDAQVHRVASVAACEHELRQRWDAVLLGWHPAEMACNEVLRSLRARARGSPLILIVDEADEASAVAAMQTGANDYLIKSNLARLIPALRHAIHASDALRIQRETAEELARSQERLRELTHHLQTHVESERIAIAREIHDDVGGSLTAVRLDLAWIARQADNPAVVARAQQIAETVTHALEASQRIQHNLRPSILEQGLVAALQWMAQRFEKRSGVAAHFSSTGIGEVEDWPDGVALTVYRTAQEALTNVSKHAHATHVQVDLTLAGGVLSLEVSDNGRGITPTDLSKARSWGIRGLDERARMVDGWIDLSSNGRGGTTLILSIPLSGERTKTMELDFDAAVQDTINDPTAWGEL